MPSILSYLSPLSIFSDFQNAFADAFDSSPEIAGYVLGMLLVLVILIAVAWAVQDTRVMLIAGVSGTVLAVLITWWPAWTLILMVIVLAVLLFRMPGMGGDE